MSSLLLALCFFAWLPAQRAPGDGRGNPGKPSGPSDPGGPDDPIGPEGPLDPPDQARFENGLALFQRDFHRSSGVGAPEMNADSCRACHSDPVVGGAGAL